MKFFFGLLVGSAIFIAVTRARSLDGDEPVQELQTRNLDVVDQPVYGQYQKRQSAYYSDGSEQDMYGDVQVAKAITDCVTSIAKTGIKRAFPKCKAYIKQVTEYCRSPNGKKTRAKDCKSVSVSIGIAIDECDVLAQKRSRKSAVTELCKTLVPPKKSKADCKPNQLFGQVPGSSTTPRCFDAPQNKRSKTQILPIRMYRPFLSKNFAQLQNLTDSTQVQGHDHTTAYAQTRLEKVIIKTLPIGQGDCTVIYCSTGPGKVHAILFDCGARGGTYLPIEYFQNHLTYVSSITVMISHGHADHYNRIPKVFDFSSEPGIKLIKKIQEVIIGGPPSDYQAKAIKFWLAAIESLKIPVKSVTNTKTIQKYDFCKDKDIMFEIVAGDASSKNERGMVMGLSCDSCGSKLLLAGDMEGYVANEMAEVSESNNVNFQHFLRATHYKMSHHGASTLANQENWLKAISPVEVHLSHQYNGRYRHPRCEALERVRSYLGTITSIGSTGHDLDCFDENRNINHLKGIKHRIYSTAPTKDVLCAIRLTFANTDESAKTEVYCGNPKDFKGGSPIELLSPNPDPGEEEDD